MINFYKIKELELINNLPDVLQYEILSYYNLPHPLTVIFISGIIKNGWNSVSSKKILNNKCVNLPIKNLEESEIDFEEWEEWEMNKPTEYESIFFNNNKNFYRKYLKEIMFECYTDSHMGMWKFVDSDYDSDNDTKD